MISLRDGWSRIKGQKPGLRGVLHVSKGGVHLTRAIILPVGLCLDCWSAKRGVHLMRAIMGGSGPGWLERIIEVHCLDVNWSLASPNEREIPCSLFDLPIY